MEDETGRLVRCPFCQSDWKMLVEERMEGYFRCLQCNRCFVLPSTIEEEKDGPSVLELVMP